MVEVATNWVEHTSRSSPVMTEPAIDLDHLGRMTLGERSIEREVLHLFEVQSAMLIERMRNGPACRIAGCAHTLKGSARGIGAWRIARASERVELSAGRWGPGFKIAMDELVQSVDDARAVIADRLRVN